MRDVVEIEEALAGLYTSGEIRFLDRVFWEHHLGAEKAFAFLRLGKREVNADFRALYKKYIADLKAGKPYQHLLGKVDFCGLSLKVNKDVLIPRPETEELAFVIKEKMPSDAKKIVDIGTGSGCLAISMAHFFPEKDVFALDISKEALELAAENAVANGVQVNFLHTDFIKNPPEKKWDAIISNPPYIPESERAEMDAVVKNEEPATALFVPDEDPLLFYKKIEKYARESLNPGGLVALETHYLHGKGVETLFSSEFYRHVERIKDMQTHDRFVFAVRK